LPEKLKELITLRNYKKCDKTDCRNYRGISIFPITYKILSKILLSRLTAHAKRINADHQCGFQRNRSNNDHIFCIRQILEKEWGFNETGHHLLIDFKKAYVSFTRRSYIIFTVSLVSP